MSFVEEWRVEDDLESIVISIDDHSVERCQLPWVVLVHHVEELARYSLTETTRTSETKLSFQGAQRANSVRSLSVPLLGVLFGVTD